MQNKNNKYIDALNRIEDLANCATGGNTDTELELYNDYNLLYEFIIENEE